MNYKILKFISDMIIVFENNLYNTLEYKCREELIWWVFYNWEWCQISYWVDWVWNWDYFWYYNIECTKFSEIVQEENFYLLFEKLIKIYDDKTYL